MLHFVLHEDCNVDFHIDAGIAPLDINSNPLRTKGMVQMEKSRHVNDFLGCHDFWWLSSSVRFVDNKVLLFSSQLNVTCLYDIHRDASYSKAIRVSRSRVALIISTVTSSLYLKTFSAIRSSRFSNPSSSSSDIFQSVEICLYIATTPSWNCCLLHVYGKTF